jgi:hypothetical protein
MRTFTFGPLVNDFIDSSPPRIQRRPLTKLKRFSNATLGQPPPSLLMSTPKRDKKLKTTCASLAWNCLIR